MPVPKDKKGDLLHIFKQGRRWGSQRTGILIKKLPTPFKKKKKCASSGDSSLFNVFLKIFAPKYYIEYDF